MYYNVYNKDKNNAQQQERQAQHMDSIAAYTPQQLQAQPLTPALFSQFVEYIDRGQKTTAVYLTNLKQFAAYMAYKAIRQPARPDIVNYRDWLAAEHPAIMLDTTAPNGWSYRKDSTGKAYNLTCKPATVKGYLQSVKAFFKWTAVNGLYPDIAANVHPPKLTTAHKKDSLQPAEVTAIENSIRERSAERIHGAATAPRDAAGRMERSTEQGARLYAMYLLAVNAGLRTIELSRANVSDFEIKGNRAYLYVWGKGHSEADQKTPIAQEVAAAIAQYLAIRKDGAPSTSPLFVSTGNRSGGKRIAATTISTMLKQALVNAGYDSERLTAHSLRHTAAANVMRMTANNIYDTQFYLRHSSPKTTEVYLQNDTTDRNAAIATQLYKYYHGTAAPDDKRQQLELITAGMDPAQLEQLATIAAALAKK